MMGIPTQIANIDYALVNLDWSCFHFSFQQALNIHLSFIMYQFKNMFGLVGHHAEPWE